LLDNKAIAAFRTAARDWVAALTKPSIGAMHQPGFQRGMYANARVTPYIHALVEHLHDQLEHAAKLGYPLAFFACDPCEKLHHLQVRQTNVAACRGAPCGRTGKRGTRPARPSESVDGIFNSHASDPRTETASSASLGDTATGR
jgi:hypothetical protein